MSKIRIPTDIKCKKITIGKNEVKINLNPRVKDIMIERAPNGGSGTIMITPRNIIGDGMNILLTLTSGSTLEMDYEDTDGSLRAISNHDDQVINMITTLCPKTYNK